MSSRFGWVDFAQEDKQRMLDIIAMCRETDTRDELGIGAIRDGFANFFFPGTSTIQTRARYFLFVPWIYQRLERDRIPSAEINAKARRDEIRLIYALLEAPPQEQNGLIGSEAKDRLQRMPSNVYWSGLGTWRIRHYGGSQDQYNRYLDAWYRRRDGAIKTDDTREPVSNRNPENWDPGLPKPPQDLLKSATFTLTREEADYLRDHILQHHKDSLLAALVCDSKLRDVDSLWDHPVVRSIGDPIQETALHARNFSDTFYGAALLYNRMMAEKSGNQEGVKGFQSRMDEWAARMEVRWSELAVWHANLERFWSCSAIADQAYGSLKRFVDTWLNYLFDAGTKKVMKLAPACQLIIDRELRLKGKRARLTNPRALELWGGASGDRALDYRWGNANQILRDILGGLGVKEAKHA